MKIGIAAGVALAGLGASWFIYKAMTSKNEPEDAKEKKSRKRGKAKEAEGEKEREKAKAKDKDKDKDKEEDKDVREGMGNVAKEDESDYEDVSEEEEGRYPLNVFEEVLVESMEYLQEFAKMCATANPEEQNARTQELMAQRSRSLVRMFVVDDSLLKIENQVCARHNINIKQYYQDVEKAEKAGNP